MSSGEDQANQLMVLVVLWSHAEHNISLKLSEDLLRPTNIASVGDLQLTSRKAQREFDEAYAFVMDGEPQKRIITLADTYQLPDDTRGLLRSIFDVKTQAP